MLWHSLAAGTCNRDGRRLAASRQSNKLIACSKAVMLKWQDIDKNEFDNENDREA